MQPEHKTTAVSVGQTWVSGNGDSRRTILFVERDQITYGWHADGEEYTCTAAQFSEWVVGTRAEREEQPHG